MDTALWIWIGVYLLGVIVTAVLGVRAGNDDYSSAIVAVLWIGYVPLLAIVLALVLVGKTALIIDDGRARAWYWVMQWRQRNARCDSRR